MTTFENYLDLALSSPCLTGEQIENAMDLILANPNPCQTAAFFAILKYRGETAEEVLGMINVLEKMAVSVSLPQPVLDIAGTGGDMAQTVNISTGAALLAAACEVPVAKHGNRSVSSRCGSADVLEAL